MVTMEEYPTMGGNDVANMQIMITGGPLTTIFFFKKKKNANQYHLKTNYPVIPPKLSGTNDAQQCYTSPTITPPPPFLPSQSFSYVYLQRPQSFNKIRKGLQDRKDL
jgi:hypothetical protein